MPQSEPVTILIISEHAESIKLITVSLRGFFPVAVWRRLFREEARAWAASNEWALILIDEQFSPGTYSLSGEFKRRPVCWDYSAQRRSDSASALQALQADVDFSSRRISGFLTESCSVQRSHRDTSP